MVKKKRSKKKKKYNIPYRTFNVLTLVFVSKYRVNVFRGSVECYDESSDEVAVVNIVSSKWIPVRVSVLISSAQLFRKFT